MKDKKKPRQHNELIDEVAGYCLMRLVNGDSWRSIIQMAVLLTINWADNDRRELNKRKK